MHRHRACGFTTGGHQKPSASVHRGQSGSVLACWIQTTGQVPGRRDLIHEACNEPHVCQVVDRPTRQERDLGRVRDTIKGRREKVISESLSLIKPYFSKTLFCEGAPRWLGSTYTLSNLAIFFRVLVGTIFSAPPYLEVQRAPGAVSSARAAGGVPIELHGNTEAREQCVDEIEDQCCFGARENVRLSPSLGESWVS